MAEKKKIEWLAVLQGFSMLLVVSKPSVNPVFSD